MEEGYLGNVLDDLDFVVDCRWEVFAKNVCFYIGA